MRSPALSDFSAVHDDGTIGVRGVDLTVSAGELVLLLGQVGSGKSSLLAAPAGLVSTTGEVRWNDRVVEDAQAELRPALVSHVAQCRACCRAPSAATSGSTTRAARSCRPPETARMGRDVAEAGGPDSLVGHRGVRLSGGQVQRLALARAVACDADLLLADDVSSALDATTELELWSALRAGGRTVIGATSKAAALAQADRVVVLDGGRVVDAGPWSVLSRKWAHLSG
ncbi:ATP-binding cassette domain-containing protein [Nocardioides sp. B-3]|uniref:ATP-binding cassette domain-containing protein n=1 Tax=Nocardioides sp. B-3 TaxID=2895565 RepID=UPI0021537E84|nr:ATP-binding cassette domain-containing protein [Nocardioides sp. B-3]UUZ58725.1 ATP-binding cassette domain-containing protein [Nocardioides sp. B-3]